MNQNERYYAYLVWRGSYKHKVTDGELKPFLREDLPVGQHGSLRKARQALLYSSNFLAKKLNITRSAYSKLEANEMRGAIKLETLTRVAEAMDCELIYAIRPKQNKLFSEVVWERIAHATERHPWVKSRPENRKARTLGFLAIEKMQEPAIRRAQHWTERKNGQN